MTSDIKAAVERVRRFYGDETYASVYGVACTGGGMLDRDEKKIVEAYLAELDDTAIDEAWLRELLGDGYDPTRNNPWREWEVPYGINGNKLIVRHDGSHCWTIIESADDDITLSLVEFTTRWQLTKLLSVLGA